MAPGGVSCALSKGLEALREHSGMAVGSGPYQNR